VGVDTSVDNDELVDKVELKLSEGTIFQMDKVGPGHYTKHLPLYALPNYANGLWFILKVLFAFMGYSLAPLPPGYSDISCPQVSLNEIIITDKNGVSHVFTSSQSGKVLPERLETLCDALTSMLPTWST
jgi:hypothetical protein